MHRYYWRRFTRDLAVLAALRLAQDHFGTLRRPGTEASIIVLTDQDSLDAGRYGPPCWSRTSDLPLRRGTLYPAELRAEYFEPRIIPCRLAEGKLRSQKRLENYTVKGKVPLWCRNLDARTYNRENRVGLGYRREL